MEIPVAHEPQIGVDAKNSKRRADFAESRLASETSRTTTGYDGTLISPSAQSYVKQAVKQFGKAAEIAEAHKQAENVALCAKKGWRFTALVVEETGHFGAGLKKFIKNISSRAELYPAAFPMVETWATPTCEAFLSQTIRCLVMRGLEARWAKQLEALFSSTATM